MRNDDDKVEESARITTPIMKGVSAMTYKQIETMREIRLWVCQLGVPVLTITAALISRPDIRKDIGRKFRNLKDTLSKKKS